MLLKRLSAMNTTKWPKINWEDPFGIKGQLCTEERMVRDATGNAK